MLRPSKDNLRKFNVDYSKDSDFSAYARLLQSKWREKMGFPAGKLGNFLETEFAKTTKANYLTSNIKNIVSSEVANTKNSGAMIQEPRIWNNLLSSQPLCFNLFGEFYFNLELATNFFKKLFPDRIGTITNIKFEYSKGRGKTEYTGDHSAFDVFVEYSLKNRKGFIGIEVKYTESLKEESVFKANETFLRHQKEYTRLTTSHIFVKNAIEFVNKPPISQIWRDHLLSIAHLKDYDEGFFVFLFPKANNDCQSGVDKYKEFLVSKKEEQSGFYPRYLDDFIKTLRNINNSEWSKELEERYLGQI